MAQRAEVFFAIPRWLLNVAGYVNHLIAFLHHAAVSGVFQQSYRELLRAEAEPTALLNHLQQIAAAQPIAEEEKWITRGEQT